MEIIDERIGDVAIITVNFERATLQEAENFKTRLSEIIDEGFKKIIVDLSVCEFLDSTFLGVLVSALKKTVRQNGDLKLIGFKPAVRSMFELTRMYRVFDSFSILDDGIKSFSN